MKLASTIIPVDTECPPDLFDSRIVILGILFFLLILILVFFRKKIPKFVFWPLVILFLFLGAFNSYEQTLIIPENYGSYCQPTGNVPHIEKETKNFTIFPNGIDEILETWEIEVY